MKIGDLVNFKYNNKIYSGKFLEKQLAMFPEYIEANENEIKLEIEDSNIRKELGLGRKKHLIIDEKSIVPQILKKARSSKKLKF